ncbi:hypothetical protein GCM10009661_44630 [Catellatospora chokoriensis]|uniref:Uncharacterized protein n=1 Tax=Catellatospora chokoriensis TaxID=310353 RepID=A0A8J3JW25_9ACTN|nr:hypothetical protein Cch02nite_55650 [Catellatospora chokoriensis]
MLIPPGRGIDEESLHVRAVGDDTVRVAEAAGVLVEELPAHRHRLDHDPTLRDELAAGCRSPAVRDPHERLKSQSDRKAVCTRARPRWPVRASVRDSDVNVELR